MNEERAKELCDELRQQIKLGPGTNARALGRVHQILEEFKSSGNDYTREKVVEAREDFEMWFTPRRWTRFAKTRGDFEQRLISSIEKLRGSISG